VFYVSSTTLTLTRPTGFATYLQKINHFKDNYFDGNQT